MQLIDYLPEHFEACVSIFHEAYLQTYPDFDEPFKPKTRFYDIMHEHVLPNNQLFVVEENDQVLGFIAVGNHFVDQLYIRDDRRGQGLGTLLLDKAKSLYPDKLELYTFAVNTPAIRFYEKHGFKVVQYGIAPDEQEPDVLMGWNGDNPGIIS